MNPDIVKEIAHSLDGTLTWFKPNTPLYAAFFDGTADNTTERVDIVTDNIANAIIREIIFYKHVVIPQQIALKKSITNVIERIDETTQPIYVDIVPLSIPKFIRIGIGMGEIYPNTFKVNEVSKPISLHYPFSTDEGSIETRISELSFGYKEELLDFIDKMPNDRVSYVYNTYIARSSINNYDVNNLLFRVDLLNNANKNDVFILFAILLYMSETYMSDALTVPANTDDYFNTIRSLYNKTVDEVIRYVNFIDGVEKNKLLFLSNNRKTANNIVVLESLYITYVINGGTPESLFGAALSDVTVANIDTMLDKKEMYINTWLTHLSLRTAADRIKNENKKIKAIEILYTDLAQEIVDEFDLPVDFNYINNIGHQELLNYEDGVERLFSDCFYAKTNYKTFLTYIKKYRNYVMEDTNGQANPVNDQIVLTLTICELVSNYVIRQVEMLKRVDKVW